jgi:hypothetical protein
MQYKSVGYKVLVDSYAAVILYPLALPVVSHGYQKLKPCMIIIMCCGFLYLQDIGIQISYPGGAL